jgi:hypothetical protein
VVISTVAVLALLGFLRYESRRNDPFIDLRFFHSIPFASATVIAVCAYAAYGAFLFMMSLYLQGARHYSAFHTGLNVSTDFCCSSDSVAVVGSVGRPLRHSAISGRGRNHDHRGDADAG